MRRLAVIFGLSLLLAACPLLAQGKVREQIKAIESYAVYYGTGRADDLARYDLIIVQPETLDATELAALKAAGTLVVAYLSVGEVEPSRPWYGDGRVHENWMLGKNPNWDSYFIDAGQVGWQDLMVAIAGEYADAGFDGLFLDTVDSAELFPDTETGMIRLIERLRSAYPDHLLIQNRGFSVLERTSETVDAVMFEDVVTSYDFEHETYIRIEPDSEAIEQLRALHDETGLVVLALDYAEPGDTETACFAAQNARALGFVPAISVIALDDLPDYHLDDACPG